MQRSRACCSFTYFLSPPPSGPTQTKIDPHNNLLMMFGLQLLKENDYCIYNQPGMLSGEVEVGTRWGKQKLRSTKTLSAPSRYVYRAHTRG
ncbi:hypothetical protein K469DRAFT_92948 [Zopfia rhizophila CBS 207.26]|uniref:Uncharacterized protein n=1 Tax=Zopfia rhizophila CBS 207.26 TaxID=1314779 RepID=A0A6A6EDU4_9PEZI|nr:hypothetical protein K469DRAFT_92948 [Zopfia rhizophila CBS 207.26]